MQARQIVPLFCTPKVAESKAFYCDKLGFREFYGNEHFVGLRLGAQGPEVCFMDSSSECTPHGSAQGLYFCFEVEEVDREHAELQRRGVEIVDAPEDQPWGDRRMTLRDPNGIMLYLFQRIRPAVEYAGMYKD